MEMLLVEVCLPAAGKRFEVRLPRNMNALLAAHLVADALVSLSNGTYLPSRSSLFAKKGNGQLLNMHRSLEQNGVKNGSCLLLI